MLTQKQIQHLSLRAGFGEPYADVKAKANKPLSILVDDLLNEKMVPISVTGKSKVSMSGFSAMTSSDKIAMRKLWRESIKDLNISWIRTMVTNKSNLREKMGIFWHDHFACSSNNIFYLESYLTTLRKHALGNFRDLLHAIAKEPAMLLYLNNQQNKKRAPNENFAREVMELFTLGRDKDYDEDDIREVARAFTGWGVTKDGKFKVRNHLHDNDEKVVFGKKGNFGGSEVLDMLLENKNTAIYLAGKLVKFFVSEKGDKQLASEVGAILYKNNYEIKPALKHLFTSDKFMDPKNIGKMIKSPIELIVGLQRMGRVVINSPQSLIYMQKMLGQKLFYPPNVAGWHSGQAWIDNATLSFRLQLPRYVFLAGTLDLIPSESADMFDQLKLRGGLKKLEAKVDQHLLEQDFARSSDTEMVDFFIQPSGNDNLYHTIKSSILKNTANLTAKPAFQLC